MVARSVQRMDAFIVQLNSDIILYDEAARQELLSGSVLGRLVSFVSFWLFGSLAFIVPLLAWRWWSRRDPIVRLEQKYLAVAKKFGLERAHYEGHMAFAARWAKARPDMAADVSAFGDLMTRIYYADEAGNLHRPQLAKCLNELKRLKP
jgi:hypothetical protein